MVDPEWARGPPHTHTQLRQGKAILLILKKKKKKVGGAGIRTSVRKIHWFTRPGRYRPRYQGATVNSNLNQNVLCLLMYLPAYKTDP